MEERPLPGAEAASVDYCARCHAVFVDYFDGDPSGIARRMAGARRAGGATLERDPRCPDCDQPLVLFPYLDSGQDLWRCEGCAGAFLTAAMVDGLAQYRWKETEDPGLVARLLGWWRGVSGDEG